jgi:hypothetical protein
MGFSSPSAWRLASYAYFFKMAMLRVLSAGSAGSPLDRVFCLELFQVPGQPLLLDLPPSHAVGDHQSFVPVAVLVGPFLALGLGPEVRGPLIDDFLAWWKC